MNERATARRALLLCALLAATACGGSGSGPTPVPTPVPTPIPTPTPVPTPTTSCSPLPPPITRWSVKAMYRNAEYWTLDATPYVGPNVEYCASVGLSGSICPVRPEDDPMRAECEAYAVGKATDTGRYGPTWTKDGKLCTGKASGCENSPDNQYQVWAYESGKYEACATNFACTSFQVAR